MTISDKASETLNAGGKMSLNTKVGIVPLEAMKRVRQELGSEEAVLRWAVATNRMYHSTQEQARDQETAKCIAAALSLMEHLISEL